jgi:hypothetical protein
VRSGDRRHRWHEDIEPRILKIWSIQGASILIVDGGSTEAHEVLATYGI